MARPLRLEFEGAWYHLMNKGAGGRLVFRCQAHREIFLNLLDQVSRIFRIEIHAYCLMGNHYHLLVRTPDANLGRAMRHLNGVYTQRVNRLSRTDGPLFRGRYKSILVDADAYLRQLSRYIHLNPVDAGIVVRPEDYPDSSYRAYLGLVPCPSWLHTSFCLSLFGEEHARERYQRFVEAGLDDEILAFYRKSRPGPILGRPAFRAEVRLRPEVEALRADPEIPDARRVQRPDLSEVSRVIGVTFGITEDDLRRVSPRAGRGHAVARGAFVCLSRFEAGYSLTSIAEWLGYRTYAGPSTAMARFRAMLREEPEIKKRLEQAYRLLYEVKT
jgi:REP element-mobilizing transposase RayT